MWWLWWPCPGLRAKIKGGKGRPRVRSVVDEPLGVEMMERWWWGYGSTAAVSHGTIPVAGRSMLASDWEKRMEKRNTTLLVCNAGDISSDGVQIVLTRVNLSWKLVNNHRVIQMPENTFIK